MKYGTKNFNDLTVEQANKIQNNRISSRFEISDDELNVFTTVDSLSNLFIEIPPMNIHTLEEILKSLQFVDGSTLHGKLQWMYLTTYYYGGKVMFRKSDSNGLCEILYLFTDEPKIHILNRNSPSLTIDGELGYRAVWLNHFHSQQNPMLVPSITLTISIDNEIYLNKSISTMVSLMQPQIQVGVINKLYSGFDEMKISLTYNNDEIENDIHLFYH